MSYEVLRNRLTSGEPFVRETALERIAALADALAITQAQADELTALARERGVDALPEDVVGRVAALEAEVKAAKDENRKLKAQVKAQNEGIAMLEECIVEMAGTVYA